LATYLKNGISAEQASRDDSQVRTTVEKMLSDIEQRGDSALRQYSVKLDKWSPESFRLTRTPGLASNG
jgi:sulfopropanediol 3-dehydrogenase